MTSKEQVREKIADYLRTHTREGDCPCKEHQQQIKDIAQAIIIILEDAGYRLPTLDVDSNKIIPDLRQWLIDRSGLSAGTELYSTYRGVFIDFRKDVVQQIKEMMESK